MIFCRIFGATNPPLQEMNRNNGTRIRLRDTSKKCATVSKSYTGESFKYYIC